MSGDVIFQERELPGGRFLALAKLRGARATDGTRVYEARGGAMFRGSEDGGTSRISVTFVSAGGAVERVNSRATSRGGQLTVDDRGTCTIADL